MGEQLGTMQAESSSFRPEAFGKYFLVDKIATGGMAEIFKAKTYSHGGFENLLVIKRILPHISANEDFVEMFIDEAKISAALQQANIVRVYDFGRILDNYFIAMECVDGKDVRNVLRKLARSRRYLPTEYCAFIAHEVCMGLAYAHTKTDLRGQPYGIVHRDITPSNVLVSYESDIKVADFGIAKAESNAYQTRDGVLKGKFEYMSPEQAEGESIDHRSDLFSLGIILHEMITSRRLFKTDSDMATIKKIRECDFRKPSAFRKDLPPGLEAICLKALSRDPNDRYASAEEMAQTLREYMFPATTETLRNQLRVFMHDLFEDEILQERQRLEDGAETARQLRDSMPLEDWDGLTAPSLGTEQGTVVTRAAPWIAGLGLTVTLALGAVLIGLIYVVAVRPDLLPELIDLPVVESEHGSIDIVVIPEARIVIDGALVATAKSHVAEELSPGTYTISFEAEGYVPVNDEIEVIAGEVSKGIYELEPVAGAGTPNPSPTPRPGTQVPVVRPPPAPQEDPEGVEPAVVRFTSVPPGAMVEVDGRSVGRTPLSWRGGAVGGRHDVVMRLDGHEDALGVLAGVEEGTQSFSLTLPPVDRPAKLTVVLATGGWANVWLDGEKLGRTAPLKDIDVPPGSHEIRVENVALGLDHTETQAFAAGKTVVVRAAP